jgi:predicted acetyltransferase
MSIELRRLSRDDWDTWYDGLLRGFGVTGLQDRELYRRLTENDRSFGAWDEGQVVGSASMVSFRMAVPGGAVVPSAGLSLVHVAATHRRNGILRSMMRRQLDEVHEAGAEPLSILTASEPEIYGRFGYGMAACGLDAAIDTTRVRITVPEESDALRLRIVDDPATVLQECEALYARRVPERPGMLERLPGWDEAAITDLPEMRDGARPLACVLAEDDRGELRGYARYALRKGWDDDNVPVGQVQLRDLEALDPAAYGALWRFLFQTDLMPTLCVEERPEDDPWLHMIGDNVRLCRPRWRDVLFARPVEVGAALAARAYSAPVDVVFEVEDAFCPWNEGRWRLSADGTGARCERTKDAAELTLSVRELGAAYLGGTTLRTLCAAGRVGEARKGALAEASRAFATDVRPWLSHGF